MSEPSLKSYIVTPEVNEEAFVARLFEEMPQRSRVPTWFAAAAAVVLLAGASALVWSRTNHQIAPGTTVQTEGSDVTVALGADGSTFTLDPKSQAQLVAIAPNDVVVQLVTGRAKFKVSHNPSRSFRVLAGTTEVRVHGTQFAVERVGDSAIVVVTEGIVEVREHGKWVMNLEASQRYPGPIASSDATGSQAAALEPELELDLGAPDAVEPTEGPERMPGVKVRNKTHRSSSRGTAPKGPAVAAPADEPIEATPPVLNAEQLFDEVRQVRREGNYAKAATMLSTLLTRFPGSAQEGLAAFELARLRMDQLGDTEGAIAPLMLAQTKLPSAPLREDAAARLVKAYQSTKRMQACEEARSEYLQRFPSGIHRPTVELLCPPASP